VKFRVLAKNKGAAMDALVGKAELDVPKALVAGEAERMVANAREDLKKRGIKDADKAPIPAELFNEQAEKRVRLGLVVAELVRSQNLQAKRWYLSDRERMAEVEAVVIENNVTDFILGKAKIADKQLPFDELMATA